MIATSRSRASFIRRVALITLLCTVPDVSASFYYVTTGGWSRFAEWRVEPFDEIIVLGRSPEEQQLEAQRDALMNRLLPPSLLAFHIMLLSALVASVGLLRHWPLARQLYVAAVTLGICIVGYTAAVAAAIEVLSAFGLATRAILAGSLAWLAWKVGSSSVAKELKDAPSSSAV